MKLLKMSLMVLAVLFAALASVPELSSAEIKSVVIDGKPFTVSFSTYTPPYAHTTPNITKADSDNSTAEGADLAIESSAGRDVEWYLSMHDEAYRAMLLETDKNAPPGEKIFENWDRSRKPVQNLSLREYHERFNYKIEFEYEEKRYAVINATMMSGEKKITTTIKTFVHQGEDWLLTNSINSHPLTQLAAFNSLEDILKIFEGGAWFTPEYKADPLSVAVRPSKPAFKSSEPLIFEVTVENISPNTRKIYSPEDSSKCVKISLKMNDQRISFGYKKKQPVDPDAFIDLAPRAPKTFEVRIEDYGTSEKGTIYSSEDMVYLPPGEYEATAEYVIDTYDDPAPQAEAGSWKSPPVKIDLIS